MIIGFDLDGTLIDSIPLHKDAFLHAAKKIGYDLTAEDFFSAMSTTAEMMLRKLVKDISDKEIKEFEKYKLKYFFSNQDRMRPFSDTVSTLHELSKKSKIIILSNTAYHDILECLEIAGINPLFFDLIVGRDLVEHPKPCPDEIFIAEKIEHHQLDYFVGDSVIDVMTGKKAGVKTIAVASGFDTREELEKAKPHKVIDHLSELIKVIT